MSAPKPQYTDAEYRELAQAAVSDYAPGGRATRHFAYYGDLPLGKTWAYTFGKSHGSGLLEQSNFDVILADLKEQFPGDVVTERSSHWAVGWTESIAVRMLDDAGNATDAGRRALDWKAKLENYPLADEGHYDDLQAEATYENVVSTLRYIGFDERTAKRIADDVISWFYENDSKEIEDRDEGGDPGDSAVKEAVKAMGWIETDEGGWVKERIIFKEPFDEP